MPVGYSHRGGDRNPIEIVVREPKSDLAWSQKLASTPVPANAQPGNKAVVELGDVVSVTRGAGPAGRSSGATAIMPTWSRPSWPANIEAPIYGMLAVDKLVRPA